MIYKSKYIVLDDQAIDIGGTNLTTLSVVEDRLGSITFLKTSEVTTEHISGYQNHIWIIGNIMSLMGRQDKIWQKLFPAIKFVKLEFDYNFCPYRGEIPHKVLGKQECSCPFGSTGHPDIADTYRHMLVNCSHWFFMSERQRAVFINHIARLDTSLTSVLSSCFSKESLETMNKLKQRSSHNNKYAIMEGFGGWHSQAKGLEQAINHCEINNLPYDILPTQPYVKHLETLARYKGLVFLPIIDDTCPRCIIEARLMGLEVITNINAQHTTESWWKTSEQTATYIQNRPKVFWETIDSIFL